MWIQRLDVKDCAGIASASVVFKPGLNVLYGPNELGKSSLVKAIRATLLLPPTSSTAEALRDWNVDAQPTVALTFEQEAQRIWRVRKSFGSRAAAYLEFSRDGDAFSQEAREREVEGTLQDILRWGINPPGGKGGKRGMPSSFITTALLGEQSDINAILAASLKDDPNDSGRDQLTQALQAMVEDPRFKAVLAAAQERVDKAFTATGRRRSGSASPWRQLREDRNNAVKRERESRQQVEDSETARVQVRELQQQVHAAEAEAEQAAGQLEAAQVAAQRRAEREEAARALADAEAQLRQALAQVRRRDEKASAVEAAEKEAATLKATLAAAEQAVADIEPRASAAREHVRQLETGDAEQGRKLREQEAENRRLKFRGQQKELQAKVAGAKELHALERTIAATETDVQERTERLDERRALLRQAKARTEADQDQLEDLELERDCARYLAARRKAQTLKEQQEAAEQHAKRAKALVRDAEEKRTSAQALNAPATAEIEHLQRLDTERRIAQAKLSVGLAVEFTPEEAGNAEIAVDGDVRKRQFNASEQLAYEAEREVRFDIEGVGALRVRGGGPALREEAQSATERWRSTAEAAFARTGVDTMDGLAAKRQQADTLLAESKQIDFDATHAQSLSEGLEALERDAVVANADAKRYRAAVAEWFDAGASVDDYVESLEQRGESAIAQQMEALAKKVSERDSLCKQMEIEVARDEQKLAGQQDDLARRREELRTSALTNEKWKELLDEADAQQERLDQDLAAVDAELAAIQAEATAEAESAQNTLTTLTHEENAKREERDETNERLQAALNQMAKLQGEAGELENLVANLDVTTLQTAYDERKSRLDELPEADDDAITDLAELEHRRDRANAIANSRRDELHTAQGALSQVGGQYVEEQAIQAKEAIDALASREHDLELEYGAWKLLRDTLAEAEKEDATHLGDALVEPVSKHMAQLTAGRYDQVDIGPHLDASGIRLGGHEHSFQELSVGTREQVALLLRLSIAEALDSFVILDDHLTQSDPIRMRWIRQLLGDAAQKIQVVVMTCHPDAYLTGDEHAVDLTQCVHRHDTAPPPATDDNAEPVPAAAEKLTPTPTRRRRREPTKDDNLDLETQLRESTRR